MGKKIQTYAMRDWEWCTSRYLHLPREVLEAPEDEELYERFLHGLEVGQIFMDPKQPLLPEGSQLKGAYWKRVSDRLDKIQELRKQGTAAGGVQNFLYAGANLHAAGYKNLGYLAILSHRSLEEAWAGTLWSYFIQPMIYAANVAPKSRHLYLGLQILWLHKIIRTDPAHTKSVVHPRLPLWLACGLCKELGRPDLARHLWNRSPMEPGPGGAYLLDRLEARTPFVLKVLLEPMDSPIKKLAEEVAAGTKRVTELDTAMRQASSELLGKSSEMLGRFDEAGAKYDAMEEKRVSDEKERFMDLQTKLKDIAEKVCGVPYVLDDLREAQADPMGHALSIYDKMNGALSPNEQKIYEAVKRHGTQKSALPELIAGGLVRNATDLNRKHMAIRSKMEKNGVVLTKGHAPAKRHEEVITGEGDDGGVIKEIMDPNSIRSLTQWAKDDDCREQTLREFAAAKPEDRAFYLETYPDIEAELNQWREKKMKSK